jgi:hypothetical protein
MIDQRRPDTVVRLLAALIGFFSFTPAKAVVPEMLR